MTNAAPATTQARHLWLAHHGPRSIPDSRTAQAVIGGREGGKNHAHSRSPDLLHDLPRIEPGMRHIKTCDAQRDSSRRPERQGPNRFQACQQSRPRRQVGQGVTLVRGRAPTGCTTNPPTNPAPRSAERPLVRAAKPRDPRASPDRLHDLPRIEPGATRSSLYPCPPKSASQTNKRSTAFVSASE